MRNTMFQKYLKLQKKLIELNRQTKLVLAEMSEFTENLSSKFRYISLDVSDKNGSVVTKYYFNNEVIIPLEFQEMINLCTSFFESLHHETVELTNFRDWLDTLTEDVDYIII